MGESARPWRAALLRGIGDPAHGGQDLRSIEPVRLKDHYLTMG